MGKFASKCATAASYIYETIEMLNIFRIIIRPHCNITKVNCLHFKIMWRPSNIFRFLIQNSNLALFVFAYQCSLPFNDLANTFIILKGNILSKKVMRVK